MRDGGLEISHGLKPFSSDHYYGGLFEKPLSPQICSLANEFGIKPSNEGGLGPLLGRVEVLYQNSRSEEMFGIETTYLDWLLKHDLKLEYVIGGFQTSALHDFGGKIGSILVPFLRYPIGNPFYFRCREGISLITKICNSEMQSDLPCPCISRAFNRPLASLFSGYTTSALSSSSEKLHVIFDIWFLVELIERKITEIDTPHLARCAIHTMTMELLGIRHVGPCARNHFDRQMKESGEDEWAEVLDEDRLLLERLDDLDEEFEREFQSRNESVRDFIRGYYSERMREVVKEMNASPTDDYRRGLLAAGVVLADPGE